MRIKSFRTFLESSDKPTPSAEKIANKHSISTAKVKKEMKSGSKIEKEHTKSQKKAEEIARDHLDEFPNYYPALRKMEKKLKKGSK